MLSVIEYANLIDEIANRRNNSIFNFNSIQFLNSILYFSVIGYIYYIIIYIYIYMIHDIHNLWGKNGGVCTETLLLSP